MDKAEIHLAVDRPLGKNARNITSTPLVWATECTNSKLPLDYLKKSNESEYLICLLTKFVYHIHGERKRNLPKIQINLQ